MPAVLVIADLVSYSGVEFVLDMPSIGALIPWLYSINQKTGAKALRLRSD